MRNKILEQVTRDLLAITPLIRRNIQRKLVKTAFSQIDQNITATHLDILKTLQLEGTLHIAEIGERLQIQKPQMTHMIDRLEELSLIVRQPEPNDRRITNVSLTDRGRDIIGEFDAVILGTVEEKLSHLDDAELEEISASLQKIKELFGCF